MGWTEKLGIFEVLVELGKSRKFDKIKALINNQIRLSFILKNFFY